MTRGQIVGGYDTGGPPHGFLRTAGQLHADQRAWRLHTLAFGPMTRAKSWDAIRMPQGPMRISEQREGSFTPIEVPGASFLTEAFGINDAGQIVGRYQDATGVHGFLDSGGSFTPIDGARRRAYQRQRDQ